MHEWWEHNLPVILAALRQLHRGQRVYIHIGAAGWRIITALAVIVIVTACGSPTSSQRFSTPGDIVTALQAAGLEAIDPAPMTKEDYGLAPMVGDGVRFLIPSVCPDCGGRAFIGSQEEITRLRTYYDEMGKSSAMFFSWVFVSPDKRAMIQINGDLPQDVASRYGSVLTGPVP